MASIRDLKKDINHVLGDIIDAVYIWEEAAGRRDSKEGSAIIDEAIGVFDELLAKVHQKEVENKKAHFNSIRTELETKANKLVDKINKLKD